MQQDKIAAGAFRLVKVGRSCRLEFTRDWAGETGRVIGPNAAQRMVNATLRGQGLPEHSVALADARIPQAIVDRFGYLVSADGAARTAKFERFAKDRALLRAIRAISPVI